jgi:hypothetical protein
MAQMAHRECEARSWEPELVWTERMAPFSMEWLELVRVASEHHQLVLAEESELPDGWAAWVAEVCRRS